MHPCASTIAFRNATVQHRPRIFQICKFPNQHPPTLLVRQATIVGDVAVAIAIVAIVGSASGTVAAPSIHGSLAQGATAVESAEGAVSRHRGAEGWVGVGEAVEGTVETGREASVEAVLSDVVGHRGAWPQPGTKSLALKNK